MWKNHRYAKKGSELASTVSVGVVTVVDKFLAVLLYGRVVKKGNACGGLSFFDVTLVVIHSMPWRLLMHILFLTSMCGIASNLRSVDEMLMTKHLRDTIVTNMFDSSHNTFSDIRRTPDLWEWGNTVLIPGLFHAQTNNGPCESKLEQTLIGVAAGQIASTLKAKRSCTEGWPDGDGSFHLGADADGPSSSPRDSTAFTVAEIAELMDDVDWTDGMSIRTMRVQSSTSCLSSTYSPTCRREFVNQDFDGQSSMVSTADYGSGLTFKHYTAEQLGGPGTVQTGNIISPEVKIDGGGYMAVVIPFFSTAFIAEARGTAASVPFDPTATDSTIVTRTNGKTPAYFCVRLSHNGEDVVQICDPNDGNGRTTGVVRAAVEAFWNDLKRSHFVDLQTRELIFTIQMRSNNQGVAARLSMVLELSATGAVLPSFTQSTVPTAVFKEYRNSDLPGYDLYRWFSTWQGIALACAIYFSLIELLEMYATGVLVYTYDIWNWVDITCFILYFVYFGRSMNAGSYYGERAAALPGGQCTHTYCQHTGFYDAYDAMSNFKIGREFLSSALILVVLKTLKFVNYYSQSTSLLAAVLAKGRRELLLFVVTLFICIFAFSVGFWVRFGSQLDDFSSIWIAFRTTLRALFGDYDLDEISDQYRPTDIAIWLFLGFAFVNIFIVLSIFLAILGEAQDAIRGEQAEAAEKAAAKRRKAEETMKKRKENQEKKKQDVAAGIKRQSTINSMQVAAGKTIKLLAKSDEAIDDGEEDVEAPEWIKFFEPESLAAMVESQFARIKAVHIGMKDEEKAKQGSVKAKDVNVDVESATAAAAPPAAAPPSAPPSPPTIEGGVEDELAVQLLAAMEKMNARLAKIEAAMS